MRDTIRFGVIAAAMVLASIMLRLFARAVLEEHEHPEGYDPEDHP